MTLIVVVTAVAARAADPQTYHVEIASSGDRAMDASLHEASELESLRTPAPVSPFGLIARARADVDRLETVLESRGFYRSRIAITIDDRPLNDPQLGDALSALPKGSDARVAIRVERGPLYHLRRIEIDGELPSAARDELKLAPGAPAIAAEVLAGAARMQTALADQGFAFAVVDPPVATEDAAAQVLDLRFRVDTGPSVRIGEIRFEGLQRVNESFARARLDLRSGEPYRASQLEKARQDLLGLGVFGAVSVKTGTAADSSGAVPITFQVSERLAHVFSLSAGYSSDLGGNGGATWTHRDLFGNAEQLKFSASVSNLGGTATTGLGYDTRVTYTTPDIGRPDQSLQLSAGALKQSLEAYEQTATTATATLSRKLSSRWSVSAGVATAREQVLQESVTRNYTLLGIPLNVLFNSTDLPSPLEDPLHGMRASLSVAPTRSFGGQDATFVVSQLSVAKYLDLQAFDLAKPGRSVLAVRALVGLAEGATTFSLPPDQRFYAGGSGTVRGYRYQSVGAQFADGNPTGGTAVTAASVEFRQRFGDNFGAAVFADAGQISSNLEPVPGDLRVGVGGGVRYYTPIGPIRLDLAFPTRRQSDSDAFEIYIGLGQAF
ncbi:MAG: BamA/TamA family outer membrane protein [Gammaproteobacteria bacterium]